MKRKTREKWNRGKGEEERREESAATPRYGFICSFINIIIGFYFTGWRVLDDSRMQYSKLEQQELSNVNSSFDLDSLMNDPEDD